MLEEAGNARSFDVETVEVPAASALGSATLERLIAEVRNSEAQQPTAYNRMHNRHNRS